MRRLSARGVGPGTTKALAAKALAVIAVTGLLLVPACGGDVIEPEPLSESEMRDNGEVVEPESTAVASPDPSVATATASPEVSASADEPAEFAFVRSYVDALNQARQTGDVEQVEALATPECSGCASLVTAIEEIHQAGGSFVGDPSWQVGSFVGKPRGTDPVEIRVQIDGGTAKVIREQGGEPQSWPSGAGLTIFRLKAETTEGTEKTAWKVQQLFQMG